MYTVKSGLEGLFTFTWSKVPESKWAGLVSNQYTFVFLRRKVQSKS